MSSRKALGTLNDQSELEKDWFAGVKSVPRDALSNTWHLNMARVQQIFFTTPNLKFILFLIFQAFSTVVSLLLHNIPLRGQFATSGGWSGSKSHV